MDEEKHQESPQADSLEELKKKLAESEAKRDEYLAGWQRAKADFINYKKEEAERLQEIARYGAEEMILELISVLDNFDLGLAALEKAGPVERGIYLIRGQIEDVLKRRGVKRIEMKAGNLYDPARAEAIGEAESEGEPGRIVEEISPGYELYGRIIRPARVRISKKKELK